MASDPVDRISETYRGRVILITGGTGLLGKVLVDKLLRCTDVKTIYLLVRSKKGKTPKERLNDIFSNVLFDLLKKEKPDEVRKCKIISGDVSEVDLGISEDDSNLLKKETEIIFHCAATTRFDISLWEAVVTNTRGTKYMLDLAHQCKNLKMFMYASTAYAFPNERVLYEKRYDPPANPHDVLSSINWINDDTMKKVTKELMGNTPNTYTFSKALSECLVQEEVGKLPICIVRPAIVIPIYKEPLPGWCQSLQGPCGLLVGAGKGVIRSMYLKADAYANFMPVDVTINCMLIMGWIYSSRKDNYIFNLTVPKDEVMMTWNDMLEMGKQVIFTKLPFNRILWYPGGSFHSSKMVHLINFYLFQMFPAIVIDLLLTLLGQKSFLVRTQQRILTGTEMFEFYTTQNWDFDCKNGLLARKLLNQVEKKKYIVHSEGLDLFQYFVDGTYFARRHILHEPDEWIPAAWRTMKIMYFVDKICKTLIVFGILYYLYKLFI